MDAKRQNPVGIEIDLRPTIDVEKRMGPGTLIGYERALRNAVDTADGVDNRVVGFTSTPVINSGNEWNTGGIECIGERLTVRINGTIVNVASGCAKTKGQIILRNQATGIELRAINIAIPN